MEKNLIGIVSKADGSARATDWGTPIVLQETSLVKVPLSPDMMQAYKQMGDDLIISLHNGEQIRIEGFFTEFEEDERSELVFEDEDGIAWLASFDPTNSEFVFSEMGAAADAAGAGAATGSISNEAWVAGALGLLALGGIIHNSSSSSSSSGSFVPPKPVEPGDTTAPNAPVVEDVINGFDDNGDITDTTIRGEAEAGSTVEVTDPVTGKVVGTVTADEDGKFEVVVGGGLEGGKDYEVTAKDPAGNVSDKETITGDTTAPDAPTAQLAEDTGLSAEDGITNNGQVDVSGLEPNATWEYSTDGGENWIAGTGDSFTLDEGRYPEGGIQVRQTDAAGNTSVSTQLGEITVDTVITPFLIAVGSRII